MQEPLGNLFKVTRYAIHDGPGIRTTIFLKGCPARCIWCSTPESQRAERELLRRASLCRACGACRDACPAMVTPAGVVHCAMCGACEAACPNGAIAICGAEWSAEALFENVYRDEPFWRRSGGGVTLSGGEVLSQVDFAVRFLALCREHCVHTAIETCLFAPLETLQRMLPLVDYVQFDIKAVSPELHRKLTLLDNRNILENAAYVLRGEVPALVRYPLVPGCNDDSAEIERLGAFLSGCARGVKAEILPYHRLGVATYEALGRVYELGETEPPSRSDVERAEAILRGYGVTIV